MILSFLCVTAAQNFSYGKKLRNAFGQQCYIEYVTVITLSCVFALVTVNAIVPMAKNEIDK